MPFKHLDRVIFIKKHFSNDALSLFYNGVFSDTFSEILISLAEHDSHKSVRKKLSFLMVEVFQNIIRHGDSNINNSTSELFGVRSIENNLNVFSSNTINEQSYEILKSKLSEINKLDASELKTLYREILESMVISEKGGAGLGLIEMARKSGNPIQHQFSTIDHTSYQFNYQLNLSSIKGVKLTEQNSTDIKENMDVYSSMVKSDILFFFKGDFNKENIQSLLTILKANTKTDSENEKLNNFRIFHTGVELIQNICRHGKNINGITEGLFALVKTHLGYYICTGNFLTSGDYSKMENHFIQLNKCSKEELNENYLKTLKENALKEDSQAGVGLIDVRRYNQTFIDYEINSDDLDFYLSIGILVPIYN